MINSPDSIMPQNAPGVKGAAAEPFKFAHRYAQLGYPVFPVKVGRKDPATEHGLRDATTDPYTIDQWLRVTPGYNIGMCADDVLAIDVDVRLPENATDDEMAAAQGELSELIRELFGDVSVPSGMPMVRTPSGGIHIYMRVDTNWGDEWGVGNTSIALGSRFKYIKQLDLKGCGRGYTILPPSQVGGKQYQNVGAYTWMLPRHGLAMMPVTCRAALEKLILESRPKRSNRNGNRKHPTQPQEPPSNELTVDQINQIVESAAAIWNEGRRQDLALALAGIMRKQGISLEQAMDVVAGVVAATADEEPGKRLTAVLSTYSADIDSIAGWSLLSDSERAALGPVLGSWPRPVNLEQSRSNNAWRSRLQRISEIQAADYPEMEWLVDGVLPARGLVVLAGRPKSGKSWLALDLALSVAAGANCMGRPVGTTGATIYLALEDSPARIKERSEIIGLSSDNAYIATSWWAADQGGYEELQEMVRELQPKLIIIDTLAAFKDGSAVVRKPQFEIDYEQARKLKTIADENNCCVLIVHHTRKADADDVFDTISGTLGLNAVADSIAILQHSRTSNVGKLHITGRDVSNEQFAVAFVDGRWIISDSATQNEETTRDKVVRTIRQWGPAKPRELRDIAAQEGIGYDALRQSLRRLAAEGVVAQDELGQYYCPYTTNPTTHTHTPPDIHTLSQCHIHTLSQCHCDTVTVTHPPKPSPAESSDWDRRHAARVLAELQQHGPKTILELSDELALEFWQIRRGLQCLQAQAQVAPTPDGRWQAVAAATEEEGETEGMTTEIGIPESAEPWIQQSARRTRDWMLEQLAQAPRDKKWLLRQAPADDEYPAVFVFDSLLRAGAVVVARSGAVWLSPSGRELWARIQASRANRAG